MILAFLPIIWLIAELFVAIQVAHAIGVLAMILLLLVSWPLGGWALRSQGRAAWRRLRTAVAAGRAPGREVLDGVLILIGGLLLIVPGFLSDLLAICALLPPTRALLRGQLARHLHSRFFVGATRLWPGRPAIRRRFDRHRRRPVPAAGMTALRTLAFGDGSVWGASWSSGPDGAAAASAPSRRRRSRLTSAYAMARGGDGRRVAPGGR